MTGYGGVGIVGGGIGGLAVTGFNSLALSLLAVVLVLGGLLLVRLATVKRRATCGPVVADRPAVSRRTGP